MTKIVCGAMAMTHTLGYAFNILINNMKIKRRAPRLDLSRLSCHDLDDINLPPGYRERANLSHELDNWRARQTR